jgi:hypothetical protein
VSSTRVSSIKMDVNAENRQRSCRTPLVIQPLGVEVLSADVDGVGSLMDGMTNLPSVNSVFSLGSGTAPSPMSSVTGVRVPSFPPRSGGSRGDNISVLSALTAPAALSGRSMFGGNIGMLDGGDKMGILGGGGALSVFIQRCPNLVSTPCC